MNNKPNMFDIRSEFISPKQVIISDDMEYPLYRQELIDFCYNQKKIDPEGKHYTNVGGWQSSDILNKLNNNTDFFIKRLKQNLKQCFDSQLMISPEYNPQIIRMWIQISGKNNYNTDHTHPMSHYSGVFYVKCKDNDLRNGCLRVSSYSNAQEFQELLFRKEEIRDEFMMHPSFSYPAKEGRLLLFPSGLNHNVSINQYDYDRISIAFDILFDR
jgi:uncharacterized protein (TIGR02466 family)